jgi:CubicO group peptidase (beta-lactamase class C family)
MNRRDSPAGRILSEESVRRMTSDQLTPEEKASSEVQPPGCWGHHGWGFGLAVATAPRVSGCPGGYGWDSGFGTYWCSDPPENMVAGEDTARMLGRHAKPAEGAASGAKPRRRREGVRGTETPGCLGAQQR